MDQKLIERAKEKFLKHIIPFKENAEKFLAATAKAHSKIEVEKWVDSNATVTGDDWRSKDDLSAETKRFLNHNKNKQK